MDYNKFRYTTNNRVSFISLFSFRMKTTNDLYKKAPLSSHSPTIHNNIRTDNDYNSTNTITESSDASTTLLIISKEP